MGYDDSRIELELDQDLIVRRALISVPAKSGQGFNVYAVRTTGTVRPDGCVPIAQQGTYRRILRPEGKPESVYKEFDVEFVEISEPLTDEQYAGRTRIDPAPDARKVKR
jgi:hypothetical protein